MRKTLSSCAILAAAVCLSAVFGGMVRSHHKDEVRKSPGQSDVAPPRFGPLATPIFSRDSSLAQKLFAMRSHPPLVGLEGPVLAHFLRLYRTEIVPNRLSPGGIDALKLLTDATASRSFYGQSIFFQTRDGVRFGLTSQGQVGESHRDLFLATFAELGLPLSTPMPSRRGKFTIADLLRDSVSNFSLDQSELPWTTVAYRIYLGSAHSWQNRDGARFTFDDLANELLVNRPLANGSCGGTHILYALTLLVRSDGQDSPLSAPLRERVITRLRSYISAAISSQSPSGYWAPSWYNGRPPHPAIFNTRFYRLLMTGHVIEWLEYLPVELQPKRDLYARAANWLFATLEAEPVLISEREACPWTHAMCSTINLVKSGTPADRPAPKKP